MIRILLAILCFCYQLNAVKPMSEITAKNAKLTNMQKMTWYTR